MATLIVTAFTPRGDNGRGVRTVGIAKALARLGEVEIAYVEFDGTEPSSDLVADLRIRFRPLRASRGLGRAAVYTQARMRHIPRALARAVSPELIGAVQDAEGFDRIVADGLATAAAITLVARNPRIIYNGHNVESGFRSSLESARHEYGSKEAFERFEQSILSSVTETWLPTHRDVEAAGKLAPGARLRYVPNVVDVVKIRPVSGRGSAGVLFVGDQSYEPNRNAADFLVGEVMPALWESLPEARLTIVGRLAERQQGLDARIDARGFVDSLADVYAAASCAVVPLREGGGSPLKMIEAMAYGLPVIATPQAARGLDAVEDRVHYVSAEGATGLAQEIGAALRGELEGLGARARDLVEKEYSIEALTELVR